MLADVPPAYHLVLAQISRPQESWHLEVPPQPSELHATSMVGTHPMLVMGRPDSAFLWPIAVFSPTENVEMFILAKLAHPAWKARKPDFSSASYTLAAMEPFDLAALRDGKLQTLKASISKAGAASPEWKDVEVRIQSIPWHTPLLRNGATVPRLLYRIFGTPDSTFLVHELSGNPDFHHVLKVRFKNRRFTQEELSGTLMVDVEDRPNVKGARLKLGDSPPGSQLREAPVSFTVERELLFREVELPDEAAPGASGPGSSAPP